MLLERFGTAGMPSDKIRKMLGRATRLAQPSRARQRNEQRVVRDLVEKVVVADNTIMIRVRRRPLLDGAVVPPSSEIRRTPSS